MNIVELHKDRMQDSFSKDFLWGAAISAKQAEGDSDRALTVADLQRLREIFPCRKSWIA